jgi:hypothetical protein
MLNTDPRFRSAIANVEKASTGGALKDALVTQIANQTSNDPYISSAGGGESYTMLSNYAGAIPTLQLSHAANMSNIDQQWFDPFDPTPLYPGIPVVRLPDIPDNCEQMDQDGNVIR